MQIHHWIRIAIETQFKGYRFRSRLEARYAVMFDALGFEWQYEPEGFDLGELGCYLPDFFLPKHNVWKEIKGGKATGIELDKCSALFAGITGEENAFDGLMLGDTDLTKTLFEKTTHAAKASGLISEVNTSVINAFFDNTTAANMLRTHVFLFEGLLDDAFMCVKSGYVQGDPLSIMRHLVAYNLLNNGYSSSNSDPTPIFANAIVAARSARFEHGEKP